MLEIKEDIWDECAKLGNITNLVLYDGEAEGFVKVRFGDPDGFAAAERCVKLMNGRSFDGRVVKAEIWDGKTKYRKSKTARGDEDEEELDRLDKFGDWLETGGD